MRTNFSFICKAIDGGRDHLTLSCLGKAYFVRGSRAGHRRHDQNLICWPVFTDS